MTGTNADRSGRPPAAPGGIDDIKVRLIPFDRPWDWLAAGWRDLWAAPAISLAYGAFALAAGLVLTLGLWQMGLEALIPVLAGGFLLIGPLLAVGLYEKSRLLAAGDTPTLAATLTAAWRSAGRLGLVAAFLLVIYFLWVRAAFLLFALFLGTGGLPPARDFMTTLLFTTNGLSLLVVGTIVGAGLALAVYATTAVSLPLLVEKRVDGFTAMAASVKSVVLNPKPMLLWAGLIAGFVALGILTLGLGLLFVFPLIGHATWHACRDLVEPPKA